MTAQTKDYTVLEQLGADLTNLPCDLRIANAQKHFDGFDLGPVSVLVPRGSVVGLIGQNGAGKTTLMRSVLGTVTLDAGQVELFGTRASDLSAAEFAKLKTRIGYVGAITAYPPCMSVAEVARVYELSYPQFSRQEFERLATSLGLLPGSARKAVKDLSRGTGMKLQLACVMASGADLLILDEPTAGLDPVVRDEVLDAIRAWMVPEGRSVLISSHITSDLDRLADYLVFLHEGRVLASCERDAVAAMGVVRLRSSELERVRADGFAKGMPSLVRDLSCDLLVSDRAAFARAYPTYPCDPASIDDVMVLLVKGEVR